MELKYVLEALNDALSLKDFEIKCLQEDKQKLKAEIKNLTEKVEELCFKYEGYKEGQK